MFERRHAMKIHIKLLTLLLVALVLVQSSVIPSLALSPIDIDSGIYQASGQPSTYSKSYNSGQRDVVATTLNGTSADAYYSGSYEYDVLSTQSASAIQSAKLRQFRDRRCFYCCKGCICFWFPLGKYSA